MAASGDVLRFVDGREFRITQAAADTNGQYLEMEWWLPPSTETPPRHIHPHQREDYEVLEGAFEVLVRDGWRTVAAGESASAPVGEVHTFRVGDRPVRVRCCGV
jgi:quercetin dioxygenase-like cupin family protein